MSARRDPRSFVGACLVQLGYSHETAETLVQRALDAHAHELAEKVRQEAQPSSAEYRAWLRVADLIDPKVE